MRILASAVVAAAAAAVLESTTALSSASSVPAAALPAFVPSSRRRRGGGGPYYSSSVRSVAREKIKPSLVVVATATTSEEVEESQEGASLPPTSPSVSASKSRLLSLAKALSPQFGGESLSGVFVTDAEKLDELKTAAAELEAVCGPSYNRGERARQLMVGDWTLLCTAVTSRRGMDGGKSNKKSKKKEGNGLPFKLPENPLAKEQQRIREKIRRSVEVTQRIRTADSAEEEGSSNNDIVRVDNVVEFSPPFQTLSDILGGDNGDAGGLFKDVKINPLEVKKTKVTLIHDASVESVSPVLRTKISLKSVVLTVAGTSQYLDPDGADVLGLNVPLGDVLRAGNFDTTYVDETLRISRGKGSGRGGGLAPEVLRVFVRKGMTTSQEEDEAALDDTFDETAADDDGEEPEEEKSELLSSAERLRDAVGEAVRDAAAAAEDAAESMAVSLTDSAAEVQSAAEDVRSAARDRAEEALKEARDNVEDRIEEAAAAVVGKEDAAKVRDVVDSTAEDVIESVKNVTEALRDAAEDLGAAAEGGAERVREAAGNASAVLNEDLEGAAKVAGEVAEDVAEAVRKGTAATDEEEEDEEGEDEIAAEDDDESEAEKGE